MVFLVGSMMPISSAFGNVYFLHQLANYKGEGNLLGVRMIFLMREGCIGKQYLKFNQNDEESTHRWWPNKSYL